MIETDIEKNGSYSIKKYLENDVNYYLSENDKLKRKSFWKHQQWKDLVSYDKQSILQFYNFVKPELRDEIFPKTPSVKKEKTDINTTPKKEKSKQNGWSQDQKENKKTKRENK